LDMQPAAAFQEEGTSKWQVAPRGAPCPLPSLSTPHASQLLTHGAQGPPWRVVGRAHAASHSCAPIPSLQPTSQPACTQQPAYDWSHGWRLFQRGVHTSSCVITCRRAAGRSNDQQHTHEVCCAHSLCTTKAPPPPKQKSTNTPFQYSKALQTCAHAVVLLAEVLCPAAACCQVARVAEITGSHTACSSPARHSKNSHTAVHVVRQTRSPQHMQLLHVNSSLRES
jgi:hypothetical protein